MKNSLFVHFWKGRNFVRHLQSGQQLEKKHPLCPHIFCFFLLISSFDTSCFLALILSLFSRFFSSFSSLFILLLVCNGSIVQTAARGITELRLPTYESNPTNRAWLPLRWHNSHTHTVSIPQPPSFIHNNSHNHLFIVRWRQGMSEKLGETGTYWLHVKTR